MEKKMQKHEFYRRYANLPIDKRMTVLDMANYGFLNIGGVYTEIHYADEAIAEIKAKQDKFLKIAEKFLPLLEKNPNL